MNNFFYLFYSYWSFIKYECLLNLPDKENLSCGIWYVHVLTCASLWIIFLIVLEKLCTGLDSVVFNIYLLQKERVAIKYSLDSKAREIISASTNPSYISLEVEWHPLLPPSLAKYQWKIRNKNCCPMRRRKCCLFKGIAAAAATTTAATATTTQLLQTLPCSLIFFLPMVMKMQMKLELVALSAAAAITILTRTQRLRK